MNKPVGRRSFLKFMSAVPVAAPMAAKASVLEFEKAVIANGVPIGNGQPYLQASTHDLPIEYMRDEISSLIKRKTKVESNKNEFVMDTASDMSIDGLRSVSAVNRARMIAEEREQRGKRRELSFLDERIADLKERLGLLGEFL